MKKVQSTYELKEENDRLLTANERQSSTIEILTALVRKLDMVSKVADFHDAFAHPVDSVDFDAESKESERYRQLGINLIKEESQELLKSLGDTEFGDGTRECKEDVLKEMCDVLVVVIGRAVSFGWDISTAFERVMHSQMSKLGADGLPIYREDGKILKGPNYEAPDLTGLCDS